MSSAAVILGCVMACVMFKYCDMILVNYFGLTLQLYAFSLNCFGLLGRMSVFLEQVCYRSGLV